MRLDKVKTAIRALQEQDAKFVAQQAVAKSDRELFDLERMRRMVLEIYCTTIQNEEARDLIGRVDREIAGIQGTAQAA